MPKKGKERKPKKKRNAYPGLRKKGMGDAYGGGQRSNQSTYRKKKKRTPSKIQQ